MRKYILRRLLIAPPILLGVLTINFFLIHGAPGSPIDLFVGDRMDEETIENLRRAHGLDQSVGVRYVKYLERALLHFDFGYSTERNRPVSDEILETLPNTLQLSFLALLIQLVVGIAVGVLSAVRQHSRFDNAARVVSLTLYSMPSFYLGILLLFLFAGGVFRVLPADGMIDVARYESMSLLEKLWDRILHIVLPAVTLGVGSAAGVSRYMRGEMLEVIRQDYIRTARAKGLSERKVIFKHALRNTLIPLITIVGLSLPFLFSGSVIVENVFSWPGMGRLAVEAARERDYPLFLAINLVFAAIVVIGNLVADVLYAVADPRIRLR